jgi:hypothetical protein
MVERRRSRRWVALGGNLTLIVCRCVDSTLILASRCHLRWSTLQVVSLKLVVLWLLLTKARE